jgi:hypothetical protein
VYITRWSEWCHKLKSGRCGAVDVVAEGGEAVGVGRIDDQAIL